MSKKPKLPSLGNWYRMYVSILDNPKLARLSEAQCWNWAKLLAVAVTYGGLIPEDLTDVAHLMRKPLGKVRDLIQVFLSAALLERCDGGYIPHDWETRQFQSDVSTGRVQEFRKRQRNVSSAVTEAAPENIVQSTETEKEVRTRATLPAEGSDVFTFCEALGVDFRADMSRIHWPALLHEAQAEGLDLKTHILPAALETRARGKASIEYALKVARSKRDARAEMPTPAVLLIEPAGERGWDARMALYRETNTWLAKWGPKWGEPGCLCPPESYVGDLPAFLDRRKAAS